jgi:hypothetical protein
MRPAYVGSLSLAHMGAYRYFTWTWWLEFIVRDRQKFKPPYLSVSLNDVLRVEITLASEGRMIHE